MKKTLDYYKVLLGPLLYYFLRSNNCLLKFIYNSETYPLHIDIRDLTMSMKLGCSFLATETPEGLDYWKKLENKFWYYEKIYDETNYTLRNNLENADVLYNFITNILKEYNSGNLNVTHYYTEMDWYEQLISFNWSKSEQGFNYWYQFVSLYYPIRYRHTETVNLFKKDNE